MATKTQTEKPQRFLVRTEQHPRFGAETIENLLNACPDGYHLHSTQVLFVPNELDIAVIYIFERDA